MHRFGSGKMFRISYGERLKIEGSNGLDAPVWENCSVAPSSATFISDLSKDILSFVLSIISKSKK